MTATYVGFIEAFPEFIGVTAGAAERQLEASRALLPQEVWGRWWERAVWLTTAHYLSLRHDLAMDLQNRNLRSPAASVGVAVARAANTNGISENVAVSRMATSDNPIEADLSRTAYGLEFLSLRNMVVAPGAIVHSPDASAALGRRQWW